MADIKIAVDDAHDIAAAVSEALRDIVERHPGTTLLGLAIDAEQVVLDVLGHADAAADDDDEM
ncbi:hypothetical protein Q5424_01125 [Conexibacter sp. JD483]|uniref:hypothetical protein n=1 Tax=unclassified Conexibacter TaxID=2627773 RepID=UPI002727BAB8|nr:MULTISPECIES: hypothetical protein [unclassified Conexibacter]MDO8185830.1 hypothetical protein [Conexibacter sp. CPCC 205706]MDO8198574.1 hypothetical protein [Conexibacter sp. CPCC 205762]MDR9367660.1 hypothetical protein [Conexibacter sp. JD483]